MGRLVEVKFNPNHDPRTGQFTTAGGGGGGGGFGGGGASGSWSDTIGKRPPASGTRSRPGVGTTVVVARAAPIASAATETLRSQKRNGYTFLIDKGNRARSMEGEITLATKPYQRSRTAQANAGGSDRRATDEGGHYIAARFNGPTDAFNHFAQDRNFNRGGYAAMENEWGRAKARNERVRISIIPEYIGESKRPYRLNIYYNINGQTKIREFENSKNGKIK